MFMAAIVQMTSTADREANLARAADLVARAAAHGARLVATPENTNYLGPAGEKVRLAEPLDGPTCRLFAELARSHQIHLLLGSFNEASDEPGRCHNTSILFGPDGARLATYRKIHLFDVDVSDSVRYRESASIKPGDRPVVAATPLGRLGLSICYDLRFGNLYRRLVRDGAEVLCVPAAFRVPVVRPRPRAVRPARRPRPPRELRPRADRRSVGPRRCDGPRRPWPRPRRDRPRTRRPRAPGHPGRRPFSS